MRAAWIPLAAQGYKSLSMIQRESIQSMNSAGSLSIFDNPFGSASLLQRVQLLEAQLATTQDQLKETRRQKAKLDYEVGGSMLWQSPCADPPG